MIGKVGILAYTIIAALSNPAAARSENLSKKVEGNTFRVEVPYANFFPECRENYEDIPCEWDFLVISRPPLTVSAGSIHSAKYDLRLPASKWNGFNYRDNNRLYPNCSKEITSSLVREISEQRQDRSPRWIASLPTELSGCFSKRIVGSEVGTDEYWVINESVLVAAVSCNPHGSVPNPICGVEIYLRDGSVAIVGGYFPYVNIENFLSRFSQVVIDLSAYIPIPEYQRELKVIFGKNYKMTATAMDVAQAKMDEVDG